MKKVFALCLTAVLCLCCLASCGSAHKENTWFSEDKLTECLVGDLPTIEKDYVNHDDGDIYVSFTSKEREAYVISVFEYLKSQNFKYLGTRGEQASTLAGSFTTYYFKPATELSEFYVDSSYKFVYSDGTLDEGGDPIFCILTIYDYEAKNLEYGTKNFAYNTLITLRYKSEAPLSGRYALNEEEHEHTGEWHTSESTHYYQYTCGCSSPDIAELHSDYDENFICDICGYVMNEHEHTYAYNHDNIGHGWSYTCGCMTPPNFAQHFDGDGDGKCDEDSCGYEYAECDHQWDDGVEIEGGLGGYVMEYTCTLCGDKQRETITIIPPSGVSHSISYQSDRTKELLMEGFAPTEAKPGDSVVLRTNPIMDADLTFYANGVKLTQTYADSDYWEYVFIMPDEDVVITHEITDGFLPD